MEDPICRSSERLKKKFSKVFRLPDRKEYLDTIQGVTPSKSFTELRPRKLINYFVTGRSRYNNSDGQPLSEDDDDLLDFIEDSSESDDWEVVSEESSDESDEEKPKAQRKPSVESDEPDSEESDESDSEESDESVDYDKLDDNSSILPTRKRIKTQISSSDEEKVKKVKRKRMRLRKRMKPRKTKVYSDDELSEDSDSLYYEPKKSLQENRSSKPKVTREKNEIGGRRLTRRKRLDEPVTRPVDDVYQITRYRKRIIFDESNNEEMELSDVEHSGHAKEADIKAHKTPVSGSSSYEGVQTKRAEEEKRKVVDDETDESDDDEICFNFNIRSSNHQGSTFKTEPNKYNTRMASAQVNTAQLPSDEDFHAKRKEGKNRRIVDDDSDVEDNHKEQTERLTRAKLKLRASRSLSETRSYVCDSSSDEDFQAKRKGGKNRRIVDDDSDAEDSLNDQRETLTTTKLRSRSSHYSPEVWPPVDDHSDDKTSKYKVFIHIEDIGNTVDAKKESNQVNLNRISSVYKSPSDDDVQQKIQNAKIHEKKTNSQVQKARRPLCDSSSDEDFHAKRKEGKNRRIIDDDSDVEDCLNEQTKSPTKTKLRSGISRYLPEVRSPVCDSSSDEDFHTKGKEGKKMRIIDDDSDVEDNQKEQTERLTRAKLKLRASRSLSETRSRVCDSSSDEDFQAKRKEGKNRRIVDDDSDAEDNQKEQTERLTRAKLKLRASRSLSETRSPVCDSSSDEDFQPKRKEGKNRRIVDDDSDVEDSQKEQTERLTRAKLKLRASRSLSEARSPVCDSSSDGDFQAKRKEGKNRRIVDDDSDVEDSQKEPTETSTRAKLKLRASRSLSETRSPMCDSSSDEDFQAKLKE